MTVSPFLRNLPMPLPATDAAWLDEVLDHLEVAALAAAGEGLDAGSDRERWVSSMQRQAVRLSRAARGRAQPAADPERELDELDAVDELAHALRDGLPNAAREVVSESQLFLLFYLAAHVHDGLVPQARAAEVLRGCWDGCADGGDDEPWPVTVAPPTTPAGWVDEIVAASRRANAPPPLPLTDGKPYAARPGALLETATVLALANRGVQPRSSAIAELIDAIRAMEEDVCGMGPEWDEMQRIPPLVFATYYVWVHLAMGLADEEAAVSVVRACSGRLAEFPPLPVGRDR